MTEPGPGATDRSVVRRGDARATAAVFVAALALYVASMSRVVYWGDSAELSVRALSFEVSPVARAYPLLRGLSWVLASALGDAALAANLVSAVFGAFTVALVHVAGREYGGCRLAGLAAAAACALAHSFWWFAGIAEVYTLHTAFLASVVLLVRGAATGSVHRRFALGFVLGLSLLHHRMIAFAAPGVALAFACDLLASVPAGDRLRRLRDAVGGLVLGALPFVLICATSSRPVPEGTADPVAWWIRDVFLGGDRNAEFFLGAGRKPFLENASYLLRWTAFNLPGPALLLAAAGAVVIVRRLDSGTVLFGLLVPFHLVFPLRYDWTGDQFSFLVPLYPVLAILVGVATGEIAGRRSPRTAALWAGSVAAAPLLLYAGVAFTPAGAAVFPGLDAGQRREVALPVRASHRMSRDWTLRLLERLPAGAALHCDWGPGQVVLYLQRAERVRTDVALHIWYRSARIGDGEAWAAVVPGTPSPPGPLAVHRTRLEDRGDGLWRIRPGEEVR